MDPGRLSEASHLLRLSTLGISLVLCSFVGLGLGWAARRFLGTGDWSLLAGLALGIAAGAWTAYEQVKPLLGAPKKKGPGAP